MAFKRQIIYYKDHYLNFYTGLPLKLQEKFDWILKLISVNQYVPGQYFKHITGTNGLFEIRVDFGSDAYRVFSFFDEGNLVILINGFQKKTQKTPQKYILLAEKIKKEYFDEK